MFYWNRVYVCNVQERMWRVTSRQWVTTRALKFLWRVVTRWRLVHNYGYDMVASVTSRTYLTTRAHLWLWRLVNTGRVVHVFFCDDSSTLDESCNCDIKMLWRVINHWRLVQLRFCDESCTSDDSCTLGTVTTRQHGTSRALNLNMLICNP